ncbi:MAG: aspartate carbamoyltransferase catalytic subunit [Acidimicrobiia bacterium]|nr:aspartate carbamoyltransferase catalytic subunit [Acidimicrobiia bacterium]MBT8250370.1 aspartate carbamoyltransferase catalytic subunit [Acidimicrobiia bacterium]NNC43859.1 aspartate carbamoyltransferase catalytic subunit [Acidimicrobiia bacterium]NND14499.1 aspartate carbamoyltransferase catalytic subunit [Acidimicrobiia bacterium]NNL28534.1 aspartate carbamoyltransferase catalytic subunit [Acidimicrobiia bacterium]
MRHLLSTEHMTATELTWILNMADEMAEVLERPIPKVPTLRGKTVGLLFFENSTRTRLSFERAAKALSADTMTFGSQGSSMTKGESLRDTALTLEALGADLMVVRHHAVGAAHRISEWVDVPVINAGDGTNQHPTQALLDVLTLRKRFGKLDGLTVAIVGDIRHSRVARSNVFAMTALGADVTLVAPPTLLPPTLDEWPVRVAHHIDDVIESTDVLYLLRIQAERGGDQVVPSLPEYVSRFGLTDERYARMSGDSVVLHPGPMNRGVEIAHGVAEADRSLVLSQVRNGVAVRMAVMMTLAGADRD